MTELQLYDMDGHTWWLATSPGQALDSYSEYYRDEVDISQLHPTEVRDADLDRLVYLDEEALYGNIKDPEHWRCPQCQQMAGELVPGWAWNQLAQVWEHLHSETESPVAAEVLRKRSFRAQLAIELADDPTTPRMFATSEI